MSSTEQRDGGASEHDETLEAMTGPEWRDDPYPLYAEMRLERPVHRRGLGIWYVTRFADVEAALRDPRLSLDHERMALAYEARYGDMPRVARLSRRVGRVMTNTDPPDHARLRRLVSKGFTARRVEDLRTRIQAIVDELLDAAAAAGPTMDLIAALASPLPATVIFELFGIPDDDRASARACFRELANPTGDLDRVELAFGQFEDYLNGTIGRRRKEPGGDIISALLAAQEREDRLSDHELLSTCFVLLTAAVQTTVNLIGNGALALLRHPDQLLRLQRDPSLIRSAVEELLRYDSPVQVIIRVVAETTDIGGQTLEPGDLVHLVIGAANRDPTHFTDPDRLDLGRSDNKSLSFGHGVHYCLGAPLALLQCEVAISTLMRRVPAVRLATDDLTWERSLVLRGLAGLPVAL